MMNLDLVVKALVESVIKSSSNQDERAAAVRTGGLPVYSDPGGILLLKRDGSIVAYDPETHSVRDTDEHWRRVALVKASRRYTSLAALLPPKHRDSVVCPACAGSGVILNGVDCANCSGLGWLDPI
jgi:hypothetical protein